MQEIPEGKKRHAQHGAAEIDEVADAIAIAPLHCWEQVKCFAQMREDDEKEQACAE
jgi:hypothetical protein